MGTSNTSVEIADKCKNNNDGSKDNVKKSNSKKSSGGHKARVSLKDVIPEGEMNLYHVYYNLIHRKDVTVCSEWKKGYSYFKKWAFENGYRDGARIVRIDKTDSFKPSNTQVILPKYNQNMKRLTSLVKANSSARFRVKYKN